MPLIMGIGDEVVHFAAAVVVMAVAALAWWSTNARPDRYRAVILRPFRYHSDTLTVRSGDTPVTLQYTNTESGIETSRTGALAVESRQSTAGARDVVPLQEMDSIVDAHMALLDNNRLHFYRRVHTLRTTQISAESTTDTETDSQEDPEPASNAQIREMDSIVSAMEADETSNCDVFSRPHGNDSNSTSLIATCQKEKTDKDPQTNSDETNEEGENTATETRIEASERKILIRLKYLNDTLKEVEGSLDELLKDFKWRHFSNELSGSFRVRLIFNGRVLGDEAATLRALGLHHRAVVHCLVHPRRTPTQRGTGDEVVPHGALEAGAARAAPERAWDLENILMTLVSIALTIVWFFRYLSLCHRYMTAWILTRLILVFRTFTLVFETCEYSNMFTASASVALFCLTVFYSVAIFGLYLSDTFHFDRRQPPLPNN